MTPSVHDVEYARIMKLIVDQGVQQPNRTGTDTLAIFGAMSKYDLRDGFPLLTTKKVNVNSIIYELLWFIKGDTNIKWLNDHGVHIWDQWADADGNLGPIYGQQWRNWGGIDQLQVAIDKIKNSPNDRRIIVSSWNVVELPLMRLPPCHLLYQFHVNEPAHRLHLSVYQRSNDWFLGNPFNIASYSFLLSMMAQITGYHPGVLTCFHADCHLYVNHYEQVMEQLSRQPFPAPQLKLNPSVVDIDDFKFEDFEIVDYKHHPAIKAEIAV